MARKKKKKGGSAGGGWLITFSDMMTLMLTFFVLLVSMATFDDRRRLITLGSLIGSFGIGTAGYDMRTVNDTRVTVEPGPLGGMDDYQMLRDKLWEDVQDDVDFQSNRFIQIISISDVVFFKPGETELMPKGKVILDYMLPLLLKINFPVLIAGHSSSLRDEQPEKTTVDLSKDRLDPSWSLSVFRTLAIYQYLVGRGVDPTQIRVEAFGRFRPKYSAQSAEGRRMNRRVDIVFDTRNQKIIKTLGPAKGPSSRNQFMFKDFLFNIPPADPGDGSAGDTDN